MNLNKLIGAILLTSAMMFCQSAFAIKANPRPVTVKQPDGTLLTVRIHGDENHHFVATTDGYRIARDADGYYRYLTLNQLTNKMQLSMQRASNVGERNIAETNFLKTVGEPTAGIKLFHLPSQTKAPAMTLSPSVLNPSANGGMKRPKAFRANAEPNESQYLCILVNFQNGRMKHQRQNFDDFLNKRGYDGYGSVKDYYRDNSNGKFVPNFTTLGPYTLSQPQSYYADNDYDTGSDQNPRAMVVEAVQLAKQNNPELDFSQFDNDGDGYMDNCYIIYAGYSEASTGNEGDMWPHSWTLGNDTITVDGIIVKNYSCSQELVGAPGNPVNPSMDGIGTFTHEFGHVLGLKDMYDTNDYYDGYGIDPGAYSLYASGSYNNFSRTPAALWAFERLQLGWMELGKDVIELKAGEDVMQDNSATTFTARYINCQPQRAADTGYEWFIVENRQLTGWDAYIPNHGMLIYHYDYTKEKWADYWNVNGPNNNARHRCVYIKCADNIDDDNTRAGDTYPGSSANTSFTDYSTPNALNWDGASANVPLTNIREDNGLIYYQAAGGASAWNVIVTEPVTSLHDTDVTLNARILSVNADVAEVGFCWAEGRCCPTLDSEHAVVAKTGQTSLLVASLKCGTTYSYRAYMKMADSSLVYGSPMEFTTEYETAHAPFMQDFKSWATGRLEGWEIADNNADGTTWVYDKNSASACYQFDYWNDADDWLISKRRYHIPENGAIFFERGVEAENYIETLEVYVSTTSSNINDFYLHKRFSLADNFGKKIWEEVDLSQYAGQDIYIAFRCCSEKMQGLLRLWDLRLAQRLATPEITYFGKGDNDDQIRVSWTPVANAAKYYLFFGKVTSQSYLTSFFSPLDYYASYSQNVDLGTGHIFFKGNGFVEIKETPSGYEDLKFMVYATGPVGTSYLDVEGTTDGIHWIPVCPRLLLSSYDTDGIECDYSNYVRGRGYTKFRFNFTDGGKLAHIRYLTLSYYDGYEWDQLAAGSTEATERIINATTPGEFTSGKYVCWVAAGDDANLFFDESPEKFYTVSSPAKETDGIADIVASQTTDNGYTYTISGQRILTPSRGIYIRNGKKIAVR